MPCPGQALRTATAQLVHTREDAGSVDEGHSQQTDSFGLPMEEVAHSWLLQHRQNLGRWEPSKEKVFLEQSEQGPGGEVGLEA